MKKIYVSAILCLFVIAARSQSTTLVISQVYGGGGNAGSIYTNDFIEIFNKGNTPISLNGYSVQYASAAGAAWAVTNLTNVTLQPGQYYLVQEAIGAGGTTPLPTPDAIGVITMGSTAGKVALVNTTTALSGAAACSGATVIDVVGYGVGTSCNETSGTAAPGNTTSVSRKLSGCQDTNDNTADFTAGAVSPRNTASPFNVCANTCTTPTTGTSNFRLHSSGSAEMSMLFTRGNGTGAIVLCKQGSVVNAAPVNGTTYTANETFGSGSQIGTGNYVVHNTTLRGVIGFTLRNVTVGTKYYFSVFEYNDPGKCYTVTGLVDSFIVGATIFKPGDMVFVGWDNSANVGEDELYLMNMVDITPGTRFSLVNSRFEAGAAANTRTYHWGGGGSDPFQDPDRSDFEYTGSGIPKGSIISMASNGPSGFSSFSVNGASVPSSTFSPILYAATSNFLSTTSLDADQLYIVQGKFTPYGTAGLDRYNILSGLVIYGITTRTPWIPLTTAVSSANTGGATRQSRIPPDILCTNTEFSSSGDGFAVTGVSFSHSQTKDQVLGLIKNTANWTIGAGTNANDVPGSYPGIETLGYTISTVSGDNSVWTGNTSSDWFDCNNWQGLHVPDSTSAVIVQNGTNPCQVNVSTSPYAAQFSNIAHADSLGIQSGSLSLLGSGSEKLYIESVLNLSSNTSLLFENNSNALSDTLVMHGYFRELANNGNFAFDPGQGTVVLGDTRFPERQASLTNTSPAYLNFYKLVMDNSRSVDATTINVNVSNDLRLVTGYINTLNPARFTLTAGCTVSSASNIYGQTNKGLQASFINGLMYYDANSSSVNLPFPIGRISTDTLFAPVELTKVNTNPATYRAEYIPAGYNNYLVDPGQLHHVSVLEYWLIFTAASNADAKVTLSWRPMSKVGDGTNNPVSLDSLMVAHFFDDDGAGINPYEWHVDGGSNVIMPKNSGANFNYGLLTTVASNANFGDFVFTLGTRGNYNLLPLKLLDLTANAVQNRVDVKWTTRDENAIAYYEVERSTDGTNFAPVARINSVNSSSVHFYGIQDLSPADGWNYYRLKILDNQQHTSYSQVVKVWVGRTGNILVYPNPAQKELKIILPSRSTTDLRIVNMSGQVVKQVSSDQLSLTINIESLSPGMYFIQIRNSRQAIVQRFSKL